MPDDEGPLLGEWEHGRGVVREPEAPTRRTVPISAPPPPSAYGGDDGGGYDDEDDYDDYEDDDRPRRRALLVALGALLFVLAGVGVAAALVASNDDDDGSNASVASTSTTRRTAPSITALPGLGGGSSTSSSSTSTTRASTSSSSSSSSSTTSTTEPQDGPACSKTGTSAAAEGNQPMKVAFCVDDPTPKVGQVLTLSGTAEDPDGGVTLDCVKVSWEGEQFGECFPPQEVPPASVNESYSFKHSFTKPGTYTIHVGARSGKPKDSFAETTLKITVHA